MTEAVVTPPTPAPTPVIVAPQPTPGRSIKVGELDETIVEQIKRSRMDPRYDHLNDLLESSPTPAYQHLNFGPYLS